MKAPERIYISSELSDVARRERIFQSDIEYIRKDLAEKMAKEFAEFVIGNEYILWEDGTWLGHNDDNTRFPVSIDDLFTEFINGRKAEKE